MPFTPTGGDVAIVKLTMGGNSEVTIPGVSWKLNGDAKTFNAMNFRDGRKRIGTLPDATLDVTLVWDDGEQPTKSTATDIRLGVTGTAKCYTSATKFFSVPVIVSGIGPENTGVEGGGVMMSVTFELNGTITYPVDP